MGAGCLYSVWVTLTGGGEVFHKAATVLASFVLLGHWFEMRARGGANEAIRTLQELAPPAAVVIRGGETVEIPTSEVQTGDLLCSRHSRLREAFMILRGRRIGEHVQEPPCSADQGRRSPTAPL